MSVKGWLGVVGTVGLLPWHLCLATSTVVSTSVWKVILDRPIPWEITLIMRCSNPINCGWTSWTIKHRLPIFPMTDYRQPLLQRLVSREKFFFFFFLYFFFLSIFLVTGLMTRLGTARFFDRCLFPTSKYHSAGSVARAFLWTPVQRVRNPGWFCLGYHFQQSYHSESVSGRPISSARIRATCTNGNAQGSCAAIPRECPKSLCTCQISTEPTFNQRASHYFTSELFLVFLYLQDPLTLIISSWLQWTIFKWK